MVTNVGLTDFAFALVTTIFVLDEAVLAKHHALRLEGARILH